MSEKKENIISIQMDISPLTEEQRLELEYLEAKSDADIDYSDIPPIEDFSKAFRPAKEITTIRIDPDVMTWLRSQGDVYKQINAILRREMLAAINTQ